MSKLFMLFSIILVVAPDFSLQRLSKEKRTHLARNHNKSKSEKIVVCYFTNWATYRSGSAKYTPENINSSLCTHINYAFAVLDNETLTMVPSDSYSDIDNRFFELVTAFKRFGLKILLSIGGWNNSAPDHWSRMMSNSTARALFITSVLELLEKYGFDGLDMNYEFPGCPQEIVTDALPNDIEYFNLLMAELKQSFAGRYLLTLASAGQRENLEKCYNMKPLCDVCDWVNVITYAYFNHLHGESGPNAPFHGTGSQFGVQETIDYYRHTLGCPADKLVLGLPFYGKSYTLADPSTPKFGAPITGPGDAGPYTVSAGSLAYYEICEYIKNGYKVGHNSVNGSYAWNDTQFISYDSLLSIETKTNIIMEYDLLGAMFWNLDYDDFNNICGYGSYPLLKTVNNILGRTDIPVTWL